MTHDSGGNFRVDITGCDAFSLVGTVFAANGSSARSQPYPVQARTDGECAPPLASLRVTPTSGGAPLTVTAESTVRHVVDPQETYTFDFGDGSPATANGANHTYTSAGTYTVTLTVRKKSSGAKATDTATVTVQPRFEATPGPTTVSPNSGTHPCPQEITLTATITANAAGSVEYQWVVNGGGTGQVTFSGPGTKTVTASSMKDAGPGKTWSSWEQLQIIGGATGARGYYSITCAGTAPAPAPETPGLMGPGGTGQG